MDRSVLCSGKLCQEAAADCGWGWGWGWGLRSRFECLMIERLYAHGPYENSFIFITVCWFGFFFMDFPHIRNGR